MSEERLERIENRLTQVEVLLEQNTSQLRQLNDLTLRLATSVETSTEKVSEDLPVLNAAVERLERVVDYLLRRDGERN